MNCLFRLAGLGLLLIAMQPVFASPNADVRVVVDISGSMRLSDPQGLRTHALELLIDLLPKDSRAGLWTFGKSPRLAVKHEQTTGLWKQLARIELAKLQNPTGESLNGQRSDLEAALRAASYDWQQQSADEWKRHIVVLTDGKVDVSADSRENALARQRLLAETLPSLVSAGYHIHTIAMGDGADLALLRELAQATGGQALNSNPQALREALVGIFQSLAVMPELPITFTGRNTPAHFTVDPGVQELQLVWFSQDNLAVDERLRIQLPNDELIDRLTAHTDLRWHVTPTFEMVTVKQPQSGLWRLRGHPAGTRVFVYSDLTIAWLEPRNRIPADVLNGFEFALFAQGQPVADEDFLALLDVEAWLNEEQPLVVEPMSERPGFRALTIGVETGVEQRLTATIRGPTFARQIHLPFMAVVPVQIEVHPAIEPDGTGPVAWITVNQPGLDQRALKVAAKVQHQLDPATIIPAQHSPAGMFKLQLPAVEGKLDVDLSLRGNYLNGNEFTFNNRGFELNLPLTATVRFPQDAARQLPVASTVTTQDAPSAPPSAPSQQTTPRQQVSANAQAPMPSLAAEAERTLPWWFVGLICLVNLGLVGGLAWLFKPSFSLPQALPTG